MLDDNLKAWIVKADSVPTDSSATYEMQKKVDAIRRCDAFNLAGIQPYDKVKVRDGPANLAELSAFAKSMSIEQLIQKEQLLGDEDLTEDEVTMLMDLEDEHSRRGNFERIFPVASNMAQYNQFFGGVRYENALVAAYLQTPQEKKNQLLSKHKRIYFSEI